MVKRYLCSKKFCVNYIAKRGNSQEILGAGRTELVIAKSSAVF